MGGQVGEVEERKWRNCEGETRRLRRERQEQRLGTSQVRHWLGAVVATIIITCYRHPRTNTSADTLMSLGSVAVLISGIAREGLQQLNKSILPERPLRKCEPVSRCSMVFK